MPDGSVVDRIAAAATALQWIRELHRDDHRLPVMVIAEWVARASDARSAERAHRALGEGCALLNVEAERAGPQLPLL
jgi:hypothetical protein